MVSAATTVLVVEDEALVRMSIAEDLEDAGFAVLEASNANEAIELLVDNPTVQALFTDVDMPGGMDGLKLAAAVRDRWPSIQIVVTSGFRIITCEQLPPDSRFMPKPYNHEELVTMLRKMTA